MFKPLRTASFLLLTLAASACGAADESATEGEDTNSPRGEATESYDMALLEEYRSALPSEEQVEAVVPGRETDPNAITVLGDSELAWLAIKSAHGVNAPAKLVVAVLRTVTLLPPTFYDSEKKEFVWGPWDNEDDYGQVMVYIRENPEEDDMKYGYALIRLVDGDLATATPVIWGGATPDEDDEDMGVGITLWDFEANAAFDKAHDPDYDAAEIRDLGRFAMLFGKGRNEEDDGNFAFNVAVFRNFVSKDAEPEEAPANLDYFYGRMHADEGTLVDFVDWELKANLCQADADTCFEEPGDGADETLNLRSAFINRGIGRAEATVSGGELSQTVSVVECWDVGLDQTYMSVSTDDELVAELGECDAPFEQTLAELGVPTLADVDPDALAAMDCVAQNGLEACDVD